MRYCPFLAGKSTSIQRRGRRQNDVDFRSKTQIESTLIYRPRNDVIESTSNQRRLEFENVARGGDYVLNFELYIMLYSCCDIIPVSYYVFAFFRGGH